MSVRNNIFFIFFLSFLLGKVNAEISDISTINFKKAVEFYKINQFIDAEAAFAKSTGYQARMAQAISAYKIDKEDKAISLFMQSVLLADNDTQRFRAINSVAVMHFLNGNYKASSIYYEDALRYSPNNIKTRQFYQASVYLKTLLEARIARNTTEPQNKRAGRGNKLRKLEDVTFDRDANLRLEDNDSKDSQTRNIFQNMISNRELLEQLISVGINAIEVNSSGILTKNNAFVDLQLQFEFSSLEHASYTSEASVSDLWKRIFEQEEGFPASLETIETIPGIRPW